VNNGCGRTLPSRNDLISPDQQRPRDRHTERLGGLQIDRRLERGGLLHGENAKGSLFLTRPSLFHYIATREDLVRRAGEVLGWIQKGELKLPIGATFPLGEAAKAHRDLEGRRTTGKVLLIP
jgi:hypothetical protein